MYKVYWTQVNEIQSKDFDSDDISGMLKFCEDLRKQRRDGGDISFITSVSENPNVVGEAGAANVAADYSWTKRRGGRYDGPHKPRTNLVSPGVDVRVKD